MELWKPGLRHCDGGQHFVQGLDIFVHEVVGLIFPTAQHRQATVVDQQVFLTRLCMNLPPWNGDNRADSDAVIEQAPEVSLERRCSLARFEN